MNDHSRRLAVATLFFVIFLDSLGNFLSLPILLRIIYEYKAQFFTHTLTVSQQHVVFGGILAAANLLSLLVIPWLGCLSDRWGRKKIIVIMLIGNIFSYLTFAIGIAQKNILLILIAKIGSSVFSQSQPIAEAAMADLSQNWRRSYYFAVIAGAMTLAMALGPLLGAYFSDTHISTFFSLNTPIHLAVLLSVVSTILVLCFYQEQNSPQQSASSIGSVAVRLFFNSGVTHKLVLYFTIFFACNYPGLYFINRLVCF